MKKLMNLWKEYELKCGSSNSNVDNTNDFRLSMSSDKISRIDYVALIVKFAKRIFPHLDNKEKNAQLVLNLLYYIAYQEKRNLSDYYGSDSATSYLVDFVLFCDF